MKKLILIAILSFAVLLCIPAVVGVVLRTSDAEALLAPLEAQSGLDFTKQSQSAGWFVSDMQFEITAPAGSPLHEDVPGQLTLRIWHGPLLWTERGIQPGLAYAELDPQLSPAVADLLKMVMPRIDQLEQMEISVLAGFKGDWEVNLSADELTFRTRDTELDVRGVEAHVDFVIHEELGTVDVQQRLAIAEIAPAAGLSSINWHMQIIGLNAELFSLYAGLMTNDPAAPAAQRLLDDVADRSALLLLQSPLSYTATVQADAYEGSHEGKLAIMWPGLSVRTLADFRLGEALRGLQVSLTYRGDESALQRSPLAQSLPLYQQQGVIEISNGEVQLVAMLKDGILTVNQQEFSLEPFLGL